MRTHLQSGWNVNLNRQVKLWAEKASTAHAVGYISLTVSVSFAICGMFFSMTEHASVTNIFLGLYIISIVVCLYYNRKSHDYIGRIVDVSNVYSLED